MIDLQNKQDELKVQSFEAPGVSAMHASLTVSSYSGIMLPPASEMRAYADILPSSPERIFAMSEKRLDHRMDMGRRFDVFKKRGQFCAITTIICSFALTAFLAYLNQPVVGGLISGATIASVALAFIYGERAAKKQD